VGSSAIKGAGFDLHLCEGGETVACVATGHGENIIETMASQKCCLSEDTKKLVTDLGASSWDLGLISVKYCS
jgi:isoaspartyl peptidase/L-asparaginase-like protein (Ntn-hydrolase superfamily)